MILFFSGISESSNLELITLTCTCVAATLFWLLLTLFIRKLKKVRPKALALKPLLVFQMGYSFLCYVPPPNNSYFGTGTPSTLSKFYMCTLLPKGCQHLSQGATISLTVSVATQLLSFLFFKDVNFCHLL